MISTCEIFVFCIVFAAACAEPSGGRTYPVRLSNNGPSATTIPIINKHVRTPTMERLPLRTAGCIPRPKTIDNVCTCYKTIVKPQVHNQIISVPSVQRVIQTAATPVIEKIHYEATPVDSPLNAVPAGASAGAAAAMALANALKGRLPSVSPASGAPAVPAVSAVPAVPAVSTVPAVPAVSTVPAVPAVTAVRALPAFPTIPTISAVSAISSGLIKPGAIVKVSPCLCRPRTVIF